MKILTYSIAAMCILAATGTTYASDVTSKENTQESMSDDNKLSQTAPIRNMPEKNMDSKSMPGHSMPDHNASKESMSNDSAPKEGWTNDNTDKGQMKN